jgi:hypothetical protein
VPTGKLLVRGLRTESDERALECRLLELPGVHGCVASSSARCVEVDFEDDRVSLAEMVEAASGLGFTATPVG